MREGFKFRELQVYQKTRKFINRVYDLTAGFPGDELFGITSQLRRGAISINLNIAEGNGRLGRNEQRQFYAVSHGSLFKCVAILDICKDRAWVPEKDFLELESEAREILAMINGLIDYVRSKS